MLMIDRAESIAGKTGANAEDDVLEPIVTSSSYALQGFGFGASQVVHAIDVDKIKREAQSLRYSDPLAYMRPRLPAMLWTLRRLMMMRLLLRLRVLPACLVMLSATLMT